MEQFETEGQSFHLDISWPNVIVFVLADFCIEHEGFEIFLHKFPQKNAGSRDSLGQKKLQK